MATRKKILSETEELHQQTQMSETTADAVPAVTIPANTQRVQEMELEIATLRATLAERETSYDLYVNERKLIEAELRDSRDMLKATLEAIPDLMFEVGLDGHYYACHAPASNLLYAPIVELVGHKIPKVVPPTVAVIVMEAIEEAHQKGFSFGKCYELNVPKGRCWFEISVARKAATSMEPRFILLVRDITARKKAEESLRVSQARYHALVDQSCEALTLVDIEKQEIVEINRRFTELLGYSLPEDAPLYANTFVVEPQSDTDRRYKTTLPGQRYLPPEIVTYRHKNGTEMPIERVGTVITIDGKDWALFSNRDMTERKKHEDAMRRSTQIQSVLREIAEAAVFAPSLPELYAKVHSLMNAVLPAKLFHINLLDEAIGEIVVPFNTDDVTIIPARRPVDRGLTEYIMRLGRAVHIPPTELIRLSEAGEYTLAKAQKVQRRHYLGAPLIDSRGKAFGVMSVILPGETQAFQPEEVAVISIIAAQVSQAIERKRTEEELKRSEAALNRQNSLFAALIKNIPIGIFMVAAPSGEPLLTNTAALALLGRGILPAANKDNLATVYQAYRAGGSEPYPLNEMPILLGMDGRECRRSVSVSVISRTFLGHVVITAS